MNCGIIAVAMGIILSIIGNLLSTAQKTKQEKLSVIGRSYLGLPSLQHSYLYGDMILLYRLTQNDIGLFFQFDVFNQLSEIISLKYQKPCHHSTNIKFLCCRIKWWQLICSHFITYIYVATVASKVFQIACVHKKLATYNGWCGRYDINIPVVKNPIILYSVL